MSLEILPCPFCGKEIDINDSDSLHNSGIYWRITNGIKYYIHYVDRYPTDNPCFELSCCEHYGGCGCNITADTKEEVISKWNTRVK